jgi:aspartate/methionine/tyrosine aminotransferase
VAIRSNTRYLVINEPFHPAGSLMSRRLQGDLIALAERHNLHLLSDEAYRLLEHDPLTRLPAMADAYLRGISLCTLSKPWGACGVTIGWLALQDNALRQACIDVQYFGSACPGRDSDAISGKKPRHYCAQFTPTGQVFSALFQIFSVGSAYRGGGWLR